ncbi:MAG: glycoside hydrolase family 28 protein [Anaerolineae bacterium]
MFDITDFGAVPDGETLNTSAIQRAIEACTEAGGGQVLVPPGTYLTGTLFLQDNVTLYLTEGATLLGSPRIEDYAPKNLIVAEGVRCVGIAGRGTIDGQGYAFWELRQPLDEWVARRRHFGWVPHHWYRHKAQASGRLVRIEDCQDVRIHDVVLTNAESWTLFILGCEDVNIRGIRILNPLIGPNTDGIDIDASCNVTVSDCYISTADDAICLKNEVEGYTDWVCRDITITNCILTTQCNAFKIGTGTRGSFENIVLSNSVIKAAEATEPLARRAAETVDPGHYGNALGPLGGVSIESVDGGDVRGVSVSNLVMKGVRAPVFVRRGNRASLEDPEAVPGQLRDVTIENVVAYDASTTSSITGLPDYPVEGVSLSNIRIETAGGGTAEMARQEPEELPTTYPESIMWGRLPAHGLLCRHVTDLTLRDLRVQPLALDARPLLICDDVQDLRVDGLVSSPRVSADPLVALKNSRHVVLRGALPARGNQTWVRVAGRTSEEILLVPDGLRPMQNAVSLGEDVSATEVHLAPLVTTNAGDGGEA